MGRTAVFLVWALCGPAHAGPVLSLDAYLSRVGQANGTLVGARHAGEASAGKQAEADLMFRPQVFGEAVWAEDARPMNPPLLAYDRLDTQHFEAGLRELTDFGLQAQLAYALDHTNYVNAPLLAGALGDLYDSGPVLQVSLSLWSNALGRSTRAQQQQARQTGLADRESAGMRALSAQVQAESSYWRLVAARQAVAIQDEALTQAQAIHGYVQKKARMRLGETSDALQASGLVALRRLALKGAQSEEQAALKAFNTAQGRPEEEPVGELQALPYLELATLELPGRRPADRPDVAQAQAQAALAEATARADEERNKPQLEAFGSYAMGARGTDYDSSQRALRAGDHDATTVGLRFSAPLDVVSSYRARAAARLAAQAQEEQLHQRMTQQESDWKVLVQQIRDIQESVVLAQQLVDAQSAKLVDARERLKDGRATTYEVLSYEQDQSQAKLQGLQLAAQLLELRGQLRLYSAPSNANAGD